MERHDAPPWPGEAAEGMVRDALAARPRGLFCDVDGTLAPIAPTPEEAALLPGVADLLRRAARVCDMVAAVSGRSAWDVRRMVGVDELIYIGNHGLEWIEAPSGDRTGVSVVVVSPRAAPYMGAVRAVASELAIHLYPRIPGVRFEHKGITASIHVRGAADPDGAEEAVYAAALAAAAPHGLRVTRGKRVIELRPPVDVDKGVATTQIIRARGLRGAIYLGDDRTDVDAFRALRRLTDAGECRGVAVAVLSPEAPADLAAAADVTLASIDWVPAFLRWVVERAEAPDERR